MSNPQIHYIYSKVTNYQLYAKLFFHFTKFIVAVFYGNVLTLKRYFPHYYTMFNIEIKIGLTRFGNTLHQC